MIVSEEENDPIDVKPANVLILGCEGVFIVPVKATKVGEEPVDTCWFIPAT